MLTVKVIDHLLIQCESARCYLYTPSLKVASGHQLFHLLRSIFLGSVPVLVFGSPRPKTWDVSLQNYMCHTSGMIL